MKALTIIQPWAWAIAHKFKRVENRTWAPPENLIGQRIAIHAGKKFAADAEERIRKMIAVSWSEEWNRWASIYPENQDDLNFGCIIATAILDGVITEPTGDSTIDKWYEGKRGWLFTDVRLTPSIQCRGNQGLWEVPNEIAAGISEAPR